mmetsp:Transcript_76234/g.210375  ORF Transcript_76234/g.210375 Transcript_76234/m.210375 type:complete len:151 (+) Transcript_76234:747-1199(+)
MSLGRHRGEAGQDAPGGTRAARVWAGLGACGVSPTLCSTMRPLLPATARPVPGYVTATSGRWEFLALYLMYPGGSQALHIDPTRCFWQVCLQGCGDAFIQVGRTTRRYVEGEMIAFDATYDHSVWVSPQAKTPRIILHASMHYCQGRYTE